MGDGQAWVGDSEGIDPSNLGIKTKHLPEGENDTDYQDRNDEAVEPGIGLECTEKLLHQNRGDEADQGQENQHAHQENAGHGQ